MTKSVNKVGNPRILEAGKATRFGAGNRASVGHGHGRPRKALSDILNENAEFALRELRKIADNPGHENWFDAVRELAKLCIPRRREITVEAGAPLGATFLELALRSIGGVAGVTADPAASAIDVTVESIDGGDDGIPPVDLTKLIAP